MTRIRKPISHCPVLFFIRGLRVIRGPSLCSEPQQRRPGLGGNADFPVGVSSSPRPAKITPASSPTTLRFQDHPIPLPTQPGRLFTGIQLPHESVAH